MLLLLFQRAKHMMQDELVRWMDIVELVKLVSLCKFLRKNQDYHLYLNIHREEGDVGDYFDALLEEKGRDITIADIITIFLKCKFIQSLKECPDEVFKDKYDNKFLGGSLIDSTLPCVKF